MKLMQLFAGVIVSAGAVVAINTATTATAGATGTTKCDIPKLGLGEKAGQNMVEKDGKITATFKVTGKNCKTDVTLATWKSPSPNGQPINDQVLFDHTTKKNLGPGTHNITTSLPDCYWQADLLVGNKATAPDGTANYAYQNGEILKVHPLRDFKFGGKQKCEEPEEPKDVCPNLEEMQEEVPEGYVIDENGNCVLIPEDPETPEEPEAPQVIGKQTPTELPSTGAGAVAATFVGVSSLSGLAHALYRKFLG